LYFAILYIVDEFLQYVFPSELQALQFSDYNYEIAKEKSG